LATQNTDVVALEEEHLGDGPAVLQQTIGVRRDFHTLGDLGRAGRGESRRPSDLDHAEPAGAAIVDAVEVAEARDVDAVFLGHLHHRLAFGARDVLAVDLERENRGRHAITSGAVIVQTPAGQTLSTM
jgi:hypothetical protein